MTEFLFSNLARFILICVVLWIAVTGMIMRFRYPDMTDVEAFLNLHRAVIFAEPNYSGNEQD